MSGTEIVLKKVSTSVAVTVTVLVLDSVKTVTKGTVTVEVEVEYSVSTSTEGITTVEVSTSVVVNMSVVVKVTGSVGSAGTTVMEGGAVTVSQSAEEESEPLSWRRRRGPAVTAETAERAIAMVEKNFMLTVWNNGGYQKETEQLHIYMNVASFNIPILMLQS